MARKPEVSIIIISYNTKAFLRQCLKSLSHTRSTEIIVVDNASTNGSPKIVKREFPQVLLIKNKKNLGFAKANNQGIETAKGKYVLFLNSDTLVPQQTIHKLLSYLERHPRAGAITPKLELRNGKIDLDCHRGFPQPWAAFCYFSGLEKLIPRSKIFGQYHQTWKNLKTIHEIDACCGAFLLTRKKVLKEVGGFDESYFFYGEDLDLCFRIKQKGWKIVYFPKAKAIHYKGASSGLRRESRDIAKVDRETRMKAAVASVEAMEIFYKKHYQGRYPWIVTKLVLLGIKLKAISRSTIGLRGRSGKIGIDIRMMGFEHAGIGRYVENLVKELKKSDAFKFVFFKTGGRHYSLKEQFLMPWIVWRSGVDLVHFPHFNVPVFCPKPFVVTIHDLIKHKFHGLSTTTRFPLIYWLKYLGYLLIFWLAVKRAKRIIVPSNSVKKELIEKYRLSPRKVVVIYEGVESKFKMQNAKCKMQKPFVIYTGSLYPHKNIERLVQVVKKLKISLVIVCSRSVFWKRMKKKIKAMKAEKFVKLLGFVPDEELVKLYQKATALVQPSLMEGFDLTVVEAMAAGLPVVISDIPVHREICGQAAIYFNPYDVDDIVKGINQVLKSPKLQRDLRKKGLQQVRRYSWPKMARQTLKVYETCLGL